MTGKYFNLFVLLPGLILLPLLQGQTIIRWDAASSTELPDWLGFQNPSAKLLQKEGIDGCLEFSPESRMIRLAPFPIQSQRQYRLRFTAWLDDRFTVEHHDRAHIKTLQGLHRPSSFEMQFFDGNKQEKRIPGYREGGFLLTAEPYEYVHEFFAPEGSVSVQISFLPNGIRTFLSKLSLSQLPESNVINCNPDLSFGELNYCGWRPARDGRLYQLPDGKAIFYSGYGGMSGIFPLQEGKQYKAVGMGRGRPNLTYLNAEGKTINSRFLFELKSGAENQAEFTPPPGTSYGRIVSYNVWLESLKIIRLAE
ncbi:MAG: hypothetical protein PHY82_00510 [Lentisphaeria bacterium]|nr:hypothetical protein [Lentisphaeria bacterium]